MKTFYESLRYEIDGLTPDSIVMDVGAHKGAFAAEIVRRYGCTVHCYEPVPEFFNILCARFRDNANIRMWPYALGWADGIIKLGVKGDMSGQFCTSPNETIEVPMRHFGDVFRKVIGRRCALLKINAEGGEYEILQSAIENDLIDDFDHISVQFHTVRPDYESLHAEIRSEIAKTHDLEYDEPFIWTGWKRR